ncbi:hypothetical protein CB1_002317005 [Camelus ferus]|nr:hypothetical protein CB1_002317005 [Camelus ferus]
MHRKKRHHWTRSLLSVFEEDAGTLTDYTNQLLQAMQRVYGAQNEMCLATQQLSKQLLAYEKQNFALGKGDEEVISTLHYFSKVVDELKTEVVKEVAAARRKQHLSSLQYYCALNALQYRKRVAMMQPMLGFAHGQWICAVNNISRQIYLTDNPEAVAIKLNQTALQAVTPITSFARKQENSCPSAKLWRHREVQDCLRENRRTAEEGHGQAGLKGLVDEWGYELVFEVQRAGKQRNHDGARNEEEHMACLVELYWGVCEGSGEGGSQEKGEPEFLDQNRGSRRANPFGETEDDTFPEAEDSLLQQMFIVRFLGSMAVKTDTTTEVIYEAMRQVLAARAIHNIFRMTESHLMVTSQTLRLIDPQTQVTRANFELTSVTQFAAHQENKRLVGFVVRMPESTGGESLSTYVFESNSEGEKICYAINLGKEIIKAQKDPEALAQLMLSIPLTSDGKYVLLNDQPDDNDGSPSENRGAESEA